MMNNEVDVSVYLSELLCSVKDVLNAVRKKMDANLSRFSELTPRGNQDNTLEYNNIN